MKATMRLAILLAALAPALAGAGDPPCRGKLSGAVTAQFECVVKVRPADEGNVVFEILPKAEIKEVVAAAPGGFMVRSPIEPGEYPMSRLGMGRASVALENKTLYIASKTSSDRGDVHLTVTSVGKGLGGVTVIRGTYRARLVPAGSGKTGEVVVEAEF